MEKRFRLRTCELIPFRESGELDDDSDEKDDAFKRHGVTTANEICETSRKVRTEDKNVNTVQETYGAPIKAPMSVPTLSKATIKPLRTLLKLQVLTSPGVEHDANRSLKSSMMRMSEIWPVS